MYNISEVFSKLHKTVVTTKDATGGNNFFLYI